MDETLSSTRRPVSHTDHALAEKLRMMVLESFGAGFNISERGSDVTLRADWMATNNGVHDIPLALVGAGTDQRLAGEISLCIFPFSHLLLMHSFLFLRRGMGEQRGVWDFSTARQS